MITTTHTYQITIYIPNQPYYFFKQHIHSQYLEDATSKSKIYTHPTFISLIKTLKQQHPYTHFTIEEL
jgi:hypothetical protein